MSGILYGVSVGPGDPELLTLQAVRVIKTCDVIVIPCSSDNNDRVAYEIARRAVPEIVDCEVIELYMPMTRDLEELGRTRAAAVELLTGLLSAGKTVAFLTLGDSSIYSTYSYLHNTVKEHGFTAKMLPGVPSFCAAAACLGEGLTQPHLPLHILPASYRSLEDGLDCPGTKVLMKAGKSLPAAIEELRRRGLLPHTKMVQRCGMEGERVFQSLDDTDFSSDYFSIVIVKDGEAG